LESNGHSESRLFFSPNGGISQGVVVAAVLAFFMLLGILVGWAVDTSGLRFGGSSELLTIIVAYLLAVAVGALISAIIAWRLYFSPRGRAFQGGASRIPVLAGAGQLVLWQPGETYIFLRNKRAAGIGDRDGGTQIILPVCGEEAIGPISLKTELLPWTDKHVLTREAQPIEISLGIWWRVSDPRRYAFSIASEIHREDAKMPTNFKATSPLANENTVIDPHRPAANWLHVWVESSVRGYVNRLGMAEVVSAQASKWLHLPADSEAQVITRRDNFEQMEEAILRDVVPKAQEYGMTVEKLAVQGITLPEKIQNVIDRTREAFLLPIQSEQEAEARYIAIKRSLEASRDVLGPETFQLNELLKNFKGANFGYFPQFLQGLFSTVDQKTLSLGTGAQNPGNTTTALSPAPDSRNIPAPPKS
jgi:regulator of protease activity HflC (stomatin/prohibitin superfamily)